MVANFIDCHWLALNSCLSLGVYADRILFLNLSSKVWELFIDVAPWKTAQIIKTINISHCQKYKLDRFSFEFIAKIHLTWDTEKSHITENVCIKLNIFYEYLAKLLAPNVTSRIKYFTPCLIYPLLKHNSTQICSTFLWTLNSLETCGRINKFTHCYLLVFTQVKSNYIKMCNFISTRWNGQLKCLTE